VLVNTHSDRSALLEQTHSSLTAAETELAAAQAGHDQLQATAGQLTDSNAALEKKLAGHADIDSRLQKITSELAEATNRSQTLSTEISALTCEQAEPGSRPCGGW